MNVMRTRDLGVVCQSIRVNDESIVVLNVRKILELDIMVPACCHRCLSLDSIDNSLYYDGLNCYYRV